MKIKLTEAELKTVVRHYISVEVENVNVKTILPTPLNSVPSITFAEILNNILDMHPTDKIAAIKLLRNMIRGLGLAEAKYAVEYPKETILRWNEKHPLH